MEYLTPLIHGGWAGSCAESRRAVHSNPLSRSLGDANLAFVKYCTSDAHVGAADGPVFSSAPYFQGGMVRAMGLLAEGQHFDTFIPVSPLAARQRGPARSVGRHGVARPRRCPWIHRALRRVVSGRPRLHVQLRRHGQQGPRSPGAGAFDDRWGCRSVARAALV